MNYNYSISHVQQIRISETLASVYVQNRIYMELMGVYEDRLSISPHLLEKKWNGIFMDLVKMLQLHPEMDLFARDEVLYPNLIKWLVGQEVIEDDELVEQVTAYFTGEYPGVNEWGASLESGYGPTLFGLQPEILKMMREAGLKGLRYLS